MFVIHVIPLIRGTQLESLSYFSSSNYELGSFIQVPIRGKNQAAIVLDSKPVSSTKTALKAATFSLRKLPNQDKPTVLPKTVRDTAARLVLLYPATVGSIIYTLLPPDVRKGARSYPVVNPILHTEDSTPQILTGRFDERILAYKSHIRSTFAHRGSVLLVVPTAVEIDYIVEELRQGIEERLVVISPSHTKRQRDDAFAKLEDETLAKLIITTPAYAYVERIDLLSIIVEQSASPHYKTRQRPYLDHRDALIAYAAVSGRSIILGDTVPRTEDEVHRRSERYTTLGEEVKRLAFTAPLTIVKQKDKPKPDCPFQLFSPELLRSATRTLEARGHVFLYAARSGLAPVVACIDCGHIFRCPDSNTPYSLIRTRTGDKEERWFVSNTSGTKVRAADVCSECGSWRLRERGVGVQHVYDEWQEKMPDSDAFIIDHLTAPTGKRAKKIADDFFAKKSGVLIGTQIALPFLSRGVEMSAVVSLDATRSIPTWRADESLFRLLLRLREFTAKEVLIQTRSETDALLTYATRGALERFYDDEISLRRMLHYPPYATFILLSWSGVEAAANEVGKLVKNSLKSGESQFYTNPNSTPQKTLAHALLRLKTDDKATYQTLLERIKTLPPYIKIEVNPERIV
ncbi:MAG: hypothetical protein AAB388_01265 [Patescibacteria group bacterium]